MRKPEGGRDPFFVYDAEGLRVQKKVNGVDTTYIPHEKTLTHASAAMMSCTSFMRIPLSRRGGTE